MRNRILTVLFFMLCSAIANPAVSQSKPSDETERHSSDESHKHTNALANETSPYLLLHAHNPVNWHGWNEQSLGLAKKENKPIFLSIGYSSCHWCHVMERESFLDEEIANFLNDNFVCIKVDREERPDVDSIYMESLAVVSPRTGGGWPLSMFLTPDAKPFFGGTYFPARDGDRGVKFGFLTVLKRVHDAWNKQTDKILQDANLVSDLVNKRLAGQAISIDAALDAQWTNRCLDRLKTTFDPEFGGFNFAPQAPNRPKFPEPSNLFFLIDQIQNAAASDEAANMLVSTCERMLMGGILDHIGGGFHRYSVDRFWKIPHFEKMLYDNGQLATVYAEAFAITKRQDFRFVVEELLEFVLREMKDDEGAFYSALDAESEGEEGKFYRWTKDEIIAALTEEEFELFAKVYGIDRSPNFENKFYAPQLRLSFSETAKSMGVEESKLIEDLKPIRKKLFTVRARRERPLTDTKILASWNGMMIRGLADAGRILENEEYLKAAKTAASFILDKMIDENGRLFRTFTDGKPQLNAYVTDYASVIDGLLAIHRATDESKWLEAAVAIQETQDQLFWDDQNGGYFYTSNDHESLLARAKRTNDGPVPAGNSVAAGNLIYFAEALNDASFLEKARRTTLAASVLIDEFPVVAPRILISARALLEKNVSN